MEVLLEPSELKGFYPALKLLKNWSKVTLKLTKTSNSEWLRGLPEAQQAVRVAELVLQSYGITYPMEDMMATRNGDGSYTVTFDRFCNSDLDKATLSVTWDSEGNVASATLTMSAVTLLRVLAVADVSPVP